MAEYLDPQGLGAFRGRADRHELGLLVHGQSSPQGTRRLGKPGFSHRRSSGSPAAAAWTPHDLSPPGPEEAELRPCPCDPDPANEWGGVTAGPRWERDEGAHEGAQAGRWPAGAPTSPGKCSGEQVQA